MSRTPLALAGALLAVPVALGVLPSAVAAPSNPKAAKGLSASSDATGGSTTAAGDPRVVVAVIDSGVNPYHEAYYDDPVSVTPEVLAELGVAPEHQVELTRTGDFAADFAADAAFWESVQPGTPYWFKGTNLVGITFDDAGTPIFSDEGDEHGTGTTSAVLDANPEAVVVLVEGLTAESETWAFSHPAVDIVSTSYGAIGSIPLPHLTESFAGVVERGKLHVGASDNSPALSPPDGTSGPWWSIGVAGWHEGDTGARESLSGNVVDVVSDFTQTLPYCTDCETGREDGVSGTSFATPRTAGTISKALLEARRAAGHTGGVRDVGGVPTMVEGGGLSLTNWELRRAMEEAAYYPGTADWDGSVDGNLPVLDPAPYVQTGWGLVSPDDQYGVVAEMLAQAGVSGEPRAAKGGDACAFNTAQFELRKAYWDSNPAYSDSFATSEDPYIRC